MNRTALLFALALVASFSWVAEAQVRIGPASASDRVFAAKTQAALPPSTHSPEVHSLEIELETAGQRWGETSEGFVIARRKGRLVLSNGKPYRRSVHGKLVELPAGDYVHGTGSRVRLGDSTVDRLEFSSRHEAMNYAALGRSYVEASSAIYEIRGNSVLTLQGPLAENPQAFAALRGAFDDRRRVDALLVASEGFFYASGRLTSPFRHQYLEALKSLRESGATTQRGTTEVVGLSSEGWRSRVQRDRETQTVSIQAGKAKHQAAIRAFARTFTAHFSKDLAESRARVKAQRATQAPLSAQARIGFRQALKPLQAGRR